MKAAVIESKNNLVVKDIDMPTMGDYDVLCEILYGGVCAGTDQHLITDTFPWEVIYPTVLGHESIGRVIKAGEKARTYKVGDLITRVGTIANDKININWGGFAEYGIARDHFAMKEDNIDIKEWDVFRVNQIIPKDTIKPSDAVMIITFRETLSYVTRLGVKNGDNVLVIGSGANGLAMAAHSKNLGANVCMVGSSKRKNTANNLKIDDYYDYKSENLLETINNKYGENFDYIIDVVGKVESLYQFMILIKDRGTVGIYGLDNYNDLSFNPFRFW